MPVAMFFSVTVAPGTTAPDESLIAPSTVAVSNCAKTDAGSNNAAAIRASVARHRRVDRQGSMGEILFSCKARRRYRNDTRGRCAEAVRMRRERGLCQGARVSGRDRDTVRLLDGRAARWRRSIAAA